MQLAYKWRHIGYFGGKRYGQTMFWPPFENFILKCEARNERSPGTVQFWILIWSAPEKMVSVHVNILHRHNLSILGGKEEQSVEKQKYLVWYNLVKILAWKGGYKVLYRTWGEKFPLSLQKNMVFSVSLKRHALPFNIHRRPHSCKKVR